MADPEKAMLVEEAGDDHEVKIMNFFLKMFLSYDPFVELDIRGSIQFVYLLRN
jgi:hypothetical protein